MNARWVRAKAHSVGGLIVFVVSVTGIGFGAISAGTQLQVFLSGVALAVLCALCALSYFAVEEMAAVAAPRAATFTLLASPASLEVGAVSGGRRPASRELWVGLACSEPTAGVMRVVVPHGYLVQPTSMHPWEPKNAAMNEWEIEVAPGQFTELGTMAISGPAEFVTSAIQVEFRAVGALEIRRLNVPLRVSPEHV